MNIHKNARLTPQGRVLLVRRITEKGWRIVEAASAAGISVRQSYRWLARYRGGGAAALADRSSAPHQCKQRAPFIIRFMILCREKPFCRRVRNLPIRRR